MRRKVKGRLREHMAAQQRKQAWVLRVWQRVYGANRALWRIRRRVRHRGRFFLLWSGHGNREHRVHVNYQIGRLLAIRLGGQCSCLQECD